MRSPFKRFFSIVILAASVVCIASSLKGEAKEEYSDLTQILLAPSGEAEEEELTLPVTADGELSDFLVPNVGGNEISPRYITLAGSPNILIYHTHTTEAYRQDSADQYKESSAYRTNDEAYNITAVGDVVEEALKAFGFDVLHDRTNHEPPKLSSSYERSLVTMQNYQKQYPNLSVYVDVHRDAANVETAQNDVVVVNNERCARIMFVVGKGEKYDEKPNWQMNYALAKAICEELEKIAPGFTRPIRVKTGRYNQQISDQCLLAEIGHNANTLAEAKNAAKYLAQAMAAVMKRGT